jgi:mannose-6-phosphate isomerase-like protein (cupin superfamily)
MSRAGTVEVTCGSKAKMLNENQSIFLPLGEKHRLSNSGVIPLEIIEFQSEGYLSEDDIVRFEDTYSKAK